MHRSVLKSAGPLAPVLFALTVLVAACSTTGPKPAPTAPATPVAPGPSAREVLDGERQRLASLFSGTPVVFVTTSDGNLQATVPRRYCFEVGDTKVKAALAAVLDRIAKSQASTHARMRVVVPTDPNARGTQLATDRAFSVRDRMSGQGIAVSRLQVTPGTGTEILELVVYPSAPE